MQISVWRPCVRTEIPHRSELLTLALGCVRSSRRLRRPAVGMKLLAGFGLPSLCLVSDAEAQANVPQCTIEWRPGPLLGGGTDSIGFFPFVSVVRDSRGRYVVAPDASGARILRFGPDGGFDSVHGRRGQGPGEFQMISAIRLWADDSLMVVDLSQARMTVLNSRLSAVRVLSLPPGIEDGLQYAGSPFMAYGVVGSRSGAGFPLHLVDANGKILRSFGADSSGARVLPGKEMRVARKFSRAGATEVWSVAVNRSLIERYSKDGSPNYQWIRQLPWFPEWNGVRRAEDVSPTPTLVTGVAEDALHRLWVTTTIRDARWCESRARRPPPGREPSITNRSEMSKYVDTIVEVIDPAARRVTASRRFGAYFLQLQDSEMMFAWQDDSSGNPRLRIQIPFVSCRSLHKD